SSAPSSTPCSSSTRRGRSSPASTRPSPSPRPPRPTTTSTTARPWARCSSRRSAVAGSMGSSLPLVAALSFGTVLLLAIPARAAGWPDERDRVLPCRPTIACTADLVAPGTLEIEAGYLYRRAAGGAVQRTWPFLIKLTVAPWVQLQVGSNGYTASPGSAPA